MASSSTSSIHKSNFKGEDTRTNFVDHLYYALKQQNIETYKDDKNLEKGKKIGKEIIEAIQESRFHIIVFSKNYASSSWCLDELFMIMECQKRPTEQTVYPIFYDVEPTEVRKQSGAFGEGFAKCKKEEYEGKWREALKEAADLGGWELKKTTNGHEAEFIKLIVKDISSKLPHVVSADENLIGMRTRIDGMVSSLNAFPDEFCMIGIAGMGGSGKTTLARAVFDQICNEFEGSSFVENVRECSNSLLIGLKSLQQEVLRDVLNRQDIIVNGVLEGKKEMKKSMPHRKVLIVLDDVDHIDQLKSLAGEPNWFMKGSIVIITTRDKQVLIAHKVNFIHDVNLLTNEEAICLLSRCAFGTEIPILGYEKLSRKVVSYAAGLPLTITILGSSLYDENEHVWIDTLKELEKIPLDGTLQKLELSYMSLDTNCKEIFLDVACILKGWEEDETIRMLESRGFHAKRGLSVLKKKHLIDISRDGYLDMHDHIQEMGRYIVRRSNLNEPRRHTRLWIEDEVKDILVNDLGTEATTCLDLISSEISPETIMKGLEKMEKLRFLFVHNFANTSDRELDEDSNYLPNSLQYLRSFNYPFCFLPKTFQASNLVSLAMRQSRLEQLWEGGERKVLHKLRFLHLNFSMKLKILDLALTPNLEILDLQCCVCLVELHIPVQCPKLKFLKLTASKLSTLDLRLVPNIETLDLNQCVYLVELHMPYECPQLKSLNLYSLKLRSLNLGLSPNIETLNLECCISLVKLDMPRECPQLKSLNLNCPNLRSFNQGPTPNIETLKLEECDYLVELDVFLECPQLESLNLRISMPRTLDFRPTPNLKILKLQRCDSLVEFRTHDECCKLKTPSLGRVELRTFDLDLTLNLEALTLDGHDDLLELLISTKCLQLKYLTLMNSKLRTLEITLNLKSLILEYCDLVELHIPDGDVKLESLRIYKCPKFTKTLELMHNLKTLTLEYCGLIELHVPNGDVKLETLEIRGCAELRTVAVNLNLKKLILHDCGLVELHIPDRDVTLKCLDIKRCSELKTLDLGRIPNLEYLFLEECSSLVKLHAPIGRLETLIHLSAQGLLRFTDFTILDVPVLPTIELYGKLVDICPLHPDNNFPKFQFKCSYREHLPSSIGNVEKLTSVGFSCACTDLQSFFGSICSLQNLTNLTLEGSIPEAPKDFDRLQCLEELTLSYIEVKHLPDSICMLKRLKYLTLYDCKLLEKLPEDLGRLESLETLRIEGCIVLRDIPKSICRMKSLSYFSLYYCTRVEELPEELGRLECLEELDITGTCINNLPPSILLLEGLLIVRSEDETPTTTTTEGLLIVRSEDETPTTTTTEGLLIVRSEDETPTTTTTEGLLIVRSEDETPTTTTTEGCCTVL